MAGVVVVVGPAAGEIELALAITMFANTDMQQRKQDQTRAHRHLAPRRTMISTRAQRVWLHVVPFSGPSIDRSIVRSLHWLPDTHTRNTDRHTDTNTQRQNKHKHKIDLKNTGGEGG